MIGVVQASTALFRLVKYISSHKKIIEFEPNCRDGSLTGKVIPLVSDTHKSSDFIAWLKIIDGQYPEQDTIRLVLDNHSAHTSKETQRYLATRPGRFEFVFTPNHGS